MEDLVSRQCSVCGSVSADPFQFKEKYRDWDLMKCRNCGFEFWWPMPIGGAGKKYFEDNYVTYFDTENEHFLQESHKNFLRYLKEDKNRAGLQKLMDVACGDGHFLSEVRKLGIEPYGIDIAGQAIMKAKKMYNLENLFYGDFFEYLKTNHPQFDAVTFFEILEHIGEPSTFVKGINELVRPGGIIGFSVPNLRRFGGYHRSSVPPHHWTRWTDVWLKNLLERNGFEIEILKYIDASPRQIIDFFNIKRFWEKKEEEKNVIWSLTPYYNPARQLFKKIVFSLARPFLYFIKKAKATHTIFVVARKVR